MSRYGGGYAGSIGSVAGTGFGISNGQAFRNIPNPNFQPAVYTLSIRSPLTGTEFASFTFPLSPQGVKRERAFLGNYYDTQGSAIDHGVARVVDQFGFAPAVYTIEGTTGWQRHLMDGFLLTGLQSIQVLEKLIEKYADLNVKQVTQGSQDLYTLEFYDYFASEFWEVVPIGPQGFIQSAAKPLYTYYRFHWVAVREVSAPILGRVDALAQVFTTPATTAVVNAANTASNLLRLYTPVGELF